MSAPSAAPPTLQEIQRKLSVHSAARPTGLKDKTPSTMSIPPSALSGNESDTESLVTPDLTSHPSANFGSALAPSTPHSLNPIAERRDGSGAEDSEDELDEGEGGWKTSSPARSQSALDETVIKTGYLWKKGERRKTWKKRWFVLRTGHIAYYKTAAEYKLLRILELSDVHSCTKVPLKKHDNTFGIVSQARTFYLQAQSSGEVDEWVSAIETARQGGPRQPKPSVQVTSPPSNPIPIPSRAGQGVPPVSPSPPSFHPSYSHNMTSSESEDGSPNKRTNSMSSQTRPQISSSPTAQSLGGPVSSLPNSQASPVKDAGKTILSGYLMKCGSKRKHWKKRWFVLTGEKLIYSGSHMDTKPHRQFPLAEVIDALEYTEPTRQPSGSSPAATSVLTGEGSDKQKHTFKVVTPKRNLLLSAPSEEDEIKWLGALRVLIARRTNAIASSPGVGETAPASAPKPVKGRRLSAASVTKPGIGLVSKSPETTIHPSAQQEP